MCQKDNNPTKEQNGAEGHFREYRPRDPRTLCYVIVSHTFGHNIVI